MKTTTTAATKDFADGPETLLASNRARPNVGGFIDQITVSAGANKDLWLVHLERHRDEVLLRGRRHGRTVILQKLTPTEVRLAGLSPRGLRLVALARIKAVGFAVE
jgi:hypothetical protein